jgi:hypothetical protein
LTDHFAALWLGWWVDANVTKADADLGKWLGVYAVFGILAVAFVGIAAGQEQPTFPLDRFYNLHYSGTF